jgi:hypothetical protein
MSSMSLIFNWFLISSSTYLIWSWLISQSQIYDGNPSVLWSYAKLGLSIFWISVFSFIKLKAFFLWISEIADYPMVLFGSYSFVLAIALNIFLSRKTVGSNSCETVSLTLLSLKDFLFSDRPLNIFSIPLGYEA